MVECKTWKEFQESGLLWWINRLLRTFGWSIVFHVDIASGEITEKVYPARVTYRVFHTSTEMEGFQRFTQHLSENIDRLQSEVNESHVWP